jgi:hypothetical protein
MEYIFTVFKNNIWKRGRNSRIFALPKNRAATNAGMLKGGTTYFENREQAKKQEASSNN